MVQEALLTPLMLTWRRLSPLDFFFSFLFLFFFSLPVRTFFTMECRDSDFAKFTVLTLKVCLKDSSQSVFHNKKNLLLLLWGAKYCTVSSHSRSSCQLGNDAKTLFPHPPSPFPWNSCNSYSSGIVLFRNSWFSFHCYTQREATPAHILARKWQLRPFATSWAKDYKGYSLVQTAQR